MLAAIRTIGLFFGFIVIGAIVGWLAISYASATYPSAQALAETTWGQEFWCKANATDYAVAFFTYCLLIVAAFQLYRSEIIVRDTERAHIFPKIMIKSFQGIPDVEVEVFPCNTGRSPGIIKCIAGRYAEAAPGFFDGYAGANRKAHDWVLAASTDAAACDTFKTADANHSFFYGLIMYMDMFGKSHESRFCTQITRGSAELSWVGSRKFNKYT
jgi:hypothetical protein